MEVVLRQHAEKSCQGDTQTEVVLRQHAERSCQGDTQMEVVLRQHAAKVVSRRYANGSRVKRHAKLSRLK